MSRGRSLHIFPLKSLAPPPTPAHPALPYSFVTSTPHLLSDPYLVHTHLHALRPYPHCLSPHAHTPASTLTPPPLPSPLHRHSFLHPHTCTPALILILAPTRPSPPHPHSFLHSHTYTASSTRTPTPLLPPSHPPILILSCLIPFPGVTFFFKASEPPFQFVFLLYPPQDTCVTLLSLPFLPILYFLPFLIKSSVLPSIFPLTLSGIQPPNAHTSPGSFEYPNSFLHTLRTSAFPSSFHS